MPDVRLTARLKDGDEITSDGEYIEASDYNMFKNQLTNLMASDKGYLNLTVDDTTVFIGRQDIVLLYLKEG